MSQAESPTKVVVVDDNLAELQFIRETLAPQGYEVITAQDAAQLDGRLDGVDIVLIDYHMPGTNGEEMLHAIKALVSPAARPYYYLYTSDRALGGVYRELGFDGQFIMKGNADALVRQIDAAKRAVSLRRMRPVM